MQSAACSSDWFAAILSSEALVISLSPSAEQYSGYSVRELVGRPIAQILADCTDCEMRRILGAAKERGYWQGEMVYRSRCGKHFNAWGAISLLAGKRNHSTDYLLLSNPNRTSASDESENSTVAGVSTTLRKFTHDLNNPLSVIMGFAQLLVLDQDCQGNMRKDIEKINFELKRVIQAVEWLHRYAYSLGEKPQVNWKSNAAG
jgi:nitrogen-specific signal transduction histidine kinase